MYVLHALNVRYITNHVLMNSSYKRTKYSFTCQTLRDLTGTEMSTKRIHQTSQQIRNILDHILTARLRQCRNFDVYILLFYTVIYAASRVHIDIRGTILRTAYRKTLQLAQATIYMRLMTQTCAMKNVIQIYFRIICLNTEAKYLHEAEISFDGFSGKDLQS